MSIGKKGISVIERMYDGNSNHDAFDFVAGFTAMYNDGKNGKPFGTSLRESNVLNDNQLKLAYNAGEIDRIKETRGGKDKPSINRDKTKTIKRAKKSDWASTDTIWYAPNEKTGKDTIIAYSTTATSDFISALAADNVNSTISEIKDMVNYDVEAKRVLQAYIDSGFGNVLASDFFGKYVSLTKTLQEETAQGKIEAETYINENTENVEDENYEQELGGIQENFESDKQNEQVLRTSRTDGAGRTDTRTEGGSGTAEEGNVGRTSQNTSNAEERIRNTKNNVYQYNEVDFDIASENARAVVKEVERLGLPAYIYEGDIYINGVLFADKEGNSKHPQGKSCDGEFILIKNNTEVPWRELSAHEISHAYETLNLKEAVAYLDAVKNNFIISSDAGSKIMEKIYENNYNNIYGEIAAQISGWLHDDIDVNELSDVLINVDEVVDTHKKFIAAVPVKEETEDVHEGIERLCSLQRAHSKSIVAARLRIDKSKEELKQLSDYAERYRKDVNAV